ncbi:MULTISPECIES: hypothetical protein [Nocardia]|uniref:hypothetical protein n=1 Tax=Nocardia TaxID=1817 RepID=UPI000D69180A|nr:MULTISPECIES: hypothetical protein [Nocardia]
MTQQDIRSLFRGIAKRYGHEIDATEIPAWLAEGNREWVWAGSVAVDDLVRAVKDFYAADPNGRITPQAVTAIIHSYYGGELPREDGAA